MMCLILIAKAILELLIIILIYVTIIIIGYFIRERLYTFYYRWKDKKFRKQYKRNYEIKLQEERRIELHKREKEKYPLFFWKEGIEINGSIKQFNSNRAYSLDYI